MAQNTETLCDKTEIEVALLLRDEQRRAEALKILSERSFWQWHNYLAILFAVLLSVYIEDHSMLDRALSWLVPAVIVFMAIASQDLGQLRRRQNALIQLLFLQNSQGVDKPPSGK